jgi:hypothetical protein
VRSSNYWAGFVSEDEITGMKKRRGKKLKRGTIATQNGRKRQTGNA